MNMVDSKHSSFFRAGLTYVSGDQVPGIGSSISVELDAATGSSFVMHHMKRAAID